MPLPQTCMVYYLFSIDGLGMKNMTKWKTDAEESCKWLTGMGFMNSSKILVLQYAGELREGCPPRAQPYGWGAFQVALVVNNLFAKAGDIRDLGSIPGSGGSPEKGMATHSSILAWRISWTEEPGTKSQTQLKWLSMHAHIESLSSTHCVLVWLYLHYPEVEDHQTETWKVCLQGPGIGRSYSLGAMMR